MTPRALSRARERAKGPGDQRPPGGRRTEGRPNDGLDTHVKVFLRDVGPWRERTWPRPCE